MNGEIYIVGSYHGFRDKILGALPDQEFRDPGIHRQSSMAKLVVDDLGAASESQQRWQFFLKEKPEEL